jgi:ribosomal protein L37AE/L43A
VTAPRADACPGPCNTAYRRAWAAYADARNRWCDRLAVELAWWHADTALGYDLPAPDPAEPESPTITPRVGEPTWCDRCTALVVRALAELDDLAALLEASSDGHRPQASEGKVSGGGGTGSPAPVAELLDELYGTLTTVEDQWRHHRGYATRPPRSHRGAHARTVCVSWLTGEAHAILGTRSQGSRTFGLTVLRWHRRLQAAGHAKPAPRRLPVRCPRCQWRALRRRDNGYVGCEQCGRLMSEDEYQDELAGQGAMAG